MDTEDLLKERGKTHGHFPDHAAVTQLIKAAIYSPHMYLPLSGATKGGTDRYDATQREGLEMIAHKIGRIVAGDPFEPDHWADIAGYARLVADHLERLRKPSRAAIGAQEDRDIYRDAAEELTSPPAPPKMYEAGTRTCKACGAPSGTHYGACPLKPKQPLDI